MLQSVLYDTRSILDRPKPPMILDAVIGESDPMLSPIADLRSTGTCCPSRLFSDMLSAIPTPARYGKEGSRQHVREEKSWTTCPGQSDSPLSTLSYFALKILVIDLLNIGDVLLATPALRVLRRAYPQAEIDILVKMQVRDIVLHNPNLSSVIGMDIKGRHRSPRHFIELVRDIRRRQYDQLINLHASARTMLLAALSGAKAKRGLASRGYEWLLHQSVEQRVDIHRAESYLQVLRDLGIPEHEHEGLEMWVDKESRLRAKEMWSEAELDSKKTIIGLNPGASVPIKQWTVNGWVELADLLTNDGMQPVFFGGPGDVALVDEIISRMHARPVSLAGKTTLLDLAALIRACEVFVSTDSGPMHIAASQKTPIAALFGPTSPAQFGPYFVPHVICRSEAPCVGCRGGPAKSHTCLAGVSATEVHNKVKCLMLNVE